MELERELGSWNGDAASCWCGFDNANGFTVIINRNTGEIALQKVTAGSAAGVPASVNVTIADTMQYTLLLTRKQSRVVARVGAAAFSYDSSSDFGTGQSGVRSSVVNVKFDDFMVVDGAARPTMTPGIGPAEQEET